MAARLAAQALEALDQDLGGERVAGEHDAQGALVGDGRDEGDASALSLQEHQTRRLALRHVATRVLRHRDAHSLVTPKDWGPLRLGPRRNGRILLGRPLSARRAASAQRRA